MSLHAEPRWHRRFRGCQQKHRCWSQQRWRRWSGWLCSRRCWSGCCRQAPSRQRVWLVQGQATIEAAFALPILMLLILLLLQPSVMLYDRIVMQGAAAEGCRLLATSADPGSKVCEDYVRRRLSAIPQMDFFHVHSGGCTWQIELSGGEDSASSTVRISTEVKPLPLIGLGAGLLGLTGANGNLTIEVEASAPTQPFWYW